MRSIRESILSVSLLSLAAGALFLTGCETWHGLGKDVGKAGDSMAGDGKYVMTVQGTPDQVTPAARRALEQMNMTDIHSSGDRSEGEVKGKTANQDSVVIEIKQSGDSNSKVTIYTHGDDADTVSKQVQDRIKSNLP